MKSTTILFSLLTLILVTSCVQETHLKTIHLKVNMKGTNTIISPGVRGQFTSPGWEKLIPLTDKDGDSIFETTIKVQAAQYGMSFKFVNNDIYELEGQNNRLITFEYKPEIITYEAVFDKPKGIQTNNNQ